MAPLNPNNTARFRFHYVSVTKNHTFQVRSTASPAAVGIAVDNFLDALSPAIFIQTITSVDFAPAGSDIFNPVVTGVEGNVHGVGAGSDFNIPWAYTFVGRTSGGRKVRLAVFGANTISGNYRVAPGEIAAVDAAITALIAGGSGFLGIDGIVPVWKNYANVQVNDHWVKEVRA